MTHETKSTNPAPAGEHSKLEDLTDAAKPETLTEAQSEATDGGILIGMLLPAVQKVR